MSSVELHSLPLFSRNWTSTKVLTELNLIKLILLAFVNSKLTNCGDMDMRQGHRVDSSG